MKISPDILIPMKGTATFLKMLISYYRSNGEWKVKSRHKREKSNEEEKERNRERGAGWEGREGWGDNRGGDWGGGRRGKEKKGKKNGGGGGEERGEKKRKEWRKKKKYVRPWQSVSLDITSYLLNWTFEYALMYSSMIAFINQGPFLSLLSDALFIYFLSQ